MRSRRARKPVYNGLLRDYPNTLLRASEHFVGLPDGQMGNSEVGHLNLGAGRIVRMDMTRIDTAIMTGRFFLWIARLWRRWIGRRGREDDCT